MIRGKTLKSVVRRLKRHLPLELPLVVRILKGLRRQGLYGQSWVVPGKYYVIDLAAVRGRLLRDDIMAHEWAHCACWGRTAVDHGPTWGVCYSRAYRIVIEGWNPRSPMRIPRGLGRGARRTRGTVAGVARWKRYAAEGPIGRLGLARSATSGSSRGTSRPCLIHAMRAPRT